VICGNKNILYGDRYNSLASENIVSFFLNNVSVLKMKLRLHCPLCDNILFFSYNPSLNWSSVVRK